MKIHQKKLFLKNRNDDPKVRLSSEGTGKQSDGGDSDMGHSAKNQHARSFKFGAVCLVLLLIGFQAALFVNKAAVLRIESLRDHPDTVYVVRYVGSGDEAAPLFGDEGGRFSGTVEDGSATDTFRRNSAHSATVQKVRGRKRQVESFRFNPNTVSVEDLQRLGFSQKQAQSIENYRSKGGRFRRKSDFAKSFVVADSVYGRLESYIDIPLLDINKADSAAFDDLPGVGPYFAAKMVWYRERLGGYSYPEQLMDIYNFDESKYNGLSDLIYCSPPSKPFRLWQLPSDSLRMHPYIGGWREAEAIVLLRKKYPSDSLSVDLLERAGILPVEKCEKLSRCCIAPFY